MAREHSSSPRMYTELASWWPLLSAPEDYLEEATFYSKTLLGAVERSTCTLLELGSGGGNNASHMKKHFDMTLVELSAKSRDLRQELFNLRLQQASAQLEKPARLRTLRRDVARLETRISVLRNKTA